MPTQTSDQNTENRGFFGRFVDYVKEERQLDRELNEKGLSGFFEDSSANRLKEAK